MFIKTTVKRNFIYALFTGVALSLMSAASLSQNIRILPMGDSVTAGEGGTNYNSYRGPLYERLKNEVDFIDFVGSTRDGSMGDPENEGHSGWKINDIASVATGVTVQYKPNLVLLHIGTNDLNGNYQVYSAPDRLAALIDQIFAAAPDTTILVAAIIRSTYGPTQEKISAYNEQAKYIVESRADAGKHIALVSMARVNDSDLDDALHPNDNGYRKMADAWYDGIKQAIGNGWIGEPKAIGPANDAYFLHPAHAKNLALDNYAADLRNDNPIILWQSQNSANQSWFFSEAYASPSGYYNLVLALGDYCLTAASANRGAGAVLRPCDGSTAQAWRATPHQGGYTLNPGNNTDLCLDVSGWGKTNGDAVGVWSCSGGANQRWELSHSSFGTGGFSKHIEAEGFSNMNGVDTEGAADSGGGQNVGWIDTGDWMVYSGINLPSNGNYKVEYRVASPNGGRLSLDFNAGGVQLGETSIPATGGWQNWTTVSHNISANAGTYDLGVFAVNGGWNINWIKITKL